MRYKCLKCNVENIPNWSADSICLIGLKISLLRNQIDETEITGQNWKMIYVTKELIWKKKQKKKQINKMNNTRANCCMYYVSFVMYFMLFENVSHKIETNSFWNGCLDIWNSHCFFMCVYMGVCICVISVCMCIV